MKKKLFLKLSAIFIVFFAVTQFTALNAAETNLNSAPAKPADEIEEILGRYEYLLNTAETFLIYENNSKILIDDGKKRLSLTKKSPNTFLIENGGEKMPHEIHFMKTKKGASKLLKIGGEKYIQKTYDALYKIKPVRSVDEIRREAYLALPPGESDATLEAGLVELSTLDAAFKFDIRYATTNNFMGAKFYESPRAYLRKPAANALSYVSKMLRARGLGIIIYDAYRPWYVTRMFYDATPDEQKNFVADPSKGSRHNRGSAVDIGLYDIASGETIDMGSGYDEFSERAYPDFIGGTSRSRWYRTLLRNCMNKAGFDVYDCEWWHFDYKPNAGKYPIMNLKFDEVDRARN